MKTKEKEIKRRIFLLSFVLLFVFNVKCIKVYCQESSEIVNKIVTSMTLKEKAQLVVGTGMYFELPDSIAKFIPNLNRPFDETDSSYSSMVSKIRKYVPGAAGNTAEFPNLGITTQVLADGPAGLRIQPRRKGENKTYYCTAFPVATLLASSWDTSLVYEVGKAMGNEVLEYGVDVLLAPGMNIQRNPLCGRNFEYYSEDPFVTGKMAAAIVKGIQSNGVGTSIKHFAANNQETNRMSVNEIISERALREIYLKGFEIAVKEGQPWTAMSAYNKINGTYASESEDLLTKILRKDWDFQGYVMTDWGGGSDVIAQLNAGNDLIMPGQSAQIQTIIDAVNKGELDISVLNTNVSRILQIMLKTPRYKGYRYTNNPDLTAHAAIVRRSASEGMVLLENRNKALPFDSKVKNVAVFGNTSFDIISGGTGSGDVNEAYTISLIEGIENAGLVPDKELMGVYKSYIKDARKKQGQSTNWLTAMMGGKMPLPEMSLNNDLIQRMAKNNDIAIITIGRNSGEGADRKAEEGDFYLSFAEKELINRVSEAFHKEGKKAVVILNIGGVIETASWNKIPDAVLLAWQPGQEAGNSIMDVLTGKVNPSGKLAVTFPLSYNDVPSSKSFPGKAVEAAKVDDRPDLSGFSFTSRVPWETIYDEDIYVGYRYYDTFEVPVAYEFGYGLSYTAFDLSNLRLSSPIFDNEIVVSINVKNIGSAPGREVVQLYVGAPSGKIEKPEQELRAFSKTRLLQPGETETVKFKLSAKDLSSFDDSVSSWIVEQGKYTVKIGNSSQKIAQTANFSVNKKNVVEKVNRALLPEQDFKRLTRNQK
jgi:beta-glucosidase